MIDWCVPCRMDGTLRCGDQIVAEVPLCKACTLAYSKEPEVLAGARRWMQEHANQLSGAGPAKVIEKPKIEMPAPHRFREPAPVTPAVVKISRTVEELSALPREVPAMPRTQQRAVETEEDRMADTLDSSQVDRALRMYSEGKSGAEIANAIGVPLWRLYQSQDYKSRKANVTSETKPAKVRTGKVRVSQSVTTACSVCGKSLRGDNRTGLCKQHRDRASERELKPVSSRALVHKPVAVDHPIECPASVSSIEAVRNYIEQQIARLTAARDALTLALEAMR